MLTVRQIQSAASFFFFFFLISFFLPHSSFAQDDDPARSRRPLPVRDIYDEQSPEIETVADSLEYLRTENKVIARGNVVITYGPVKITADRAEVETDTKKAHAAGHVIIFRDDAPIARGDEIFYNFSNQTGLFPDGTVLNYPWRCTAEEIEKVDKDTVKARNAVFTTCRGDPPPYEVKAKTVTIHDDDKIVAKNVTVYSLGKPIFWWPYLVIPLQPASLPLSVRPGYNSRFGPYIEVSKGFSINKYLYGTLHADYRAKRGFGTGGDLYYDYGKWASGKIKGYWTQDERAPTPGAPNPFALLEDRDRGRISWWHRTDFDPDTYLQLRYHRLADEYFLQDFFHKEHREDIEPHSFITLTKNSEKFGSYVHLTKQMNNFESLVERLPEVRFDWKNQPFFMDGLFYENQNSYSNLNKKHGRLGFDEHVNRFDHVSRWFLPMKYETINIMPFWGARGTYYSREFESDNNHFRTVADFGADVRTHFFRTFDVTFDRAGIEVNRLRHVVEPFVRYEGIRSSVSDEKLTHFDRVDTIDDQDLFTFGLENRFQTKRVVDGRIQRVDIVSLNTFLNFEINPGNRGHGTSFTTFNQELILRPYNWLQYRIHYEYDFLDSQFRSLNQDLLARTGRLRFVFGHRYIHGIDVSEGSSQLVFDGRYVINKLWTAGGYIRWSADENSLEEWQVSATRDMDCLIFDFGYNVRNSSIRSSNKELFFNLRLKHYPQLALRGGGARASFSEPRIGETVAGANQFGRASYYEVQ